MIARALRRLLSIDDVRIKRGKSGKYFWQRLDGRTGRKLSISPMPPFDTYAEAQSAAQRANRGRWRFI